MSAQGRWVLQLALIAIPLVFVPAEAAAERADRVAAGQYHTCALTSIGTVLCWGDNRYGQVGDGTTTNRPVPLAVAGVGRGALVVASGWDHACAVTSAGGVKCWGYNFWGQLGDGSQVSRSTPTDVVGLTSGAIALAAGANHTCALMNGGGVKCWGNNGFGQLGDGTQVSRTTAADVAGLTGGAVALAAGANHMCALMASGVVSCWGENSRGQLGDGTTTTRTAPVGVGGFGATLVGVSAGYFHTCAVTIGGGGWCWGGNFNSQLGDGTTTDRLTPVAVSGLTTGVRLVSAGKYHTCAATSVGALKCWGLNTYYQVGDGTNTLRSTPTNVIGLNSGVAEVSSGGYHTCAEMVVGAVRCWGHNYYGELGNANTTDQPARVPAIGFGSPLGDLNRDGRSDVVWHHATAGDIWLWPMDNAAPTSQTYVGTVADTGWQIQGLGDQTGDGKVDLLWRHQTTGAIFLWVMDGTSVLSQHYVGAVVPEYAIVGTGDYTGDGQSDILWRHLTTGDLWLWQMDGPTLESAIRVGTVALGYQVVGSGDVNTDGRADILWRHQSSGEVWIWLMNGSVIDSVTFMGTVVDLNYRVAGLADYDGDSNADVVWRHETTGDVWLWGMRGGSVSAISHIATVVDPQYRIVGNGDYDGDGKADVLWHHATSGALWVWLMNGAAITSATWMATVADVGYQVVSTR